MNADDVHSRSDWELFVEEHGHPPFWRPRHHHNLDGCHQQSHRMDGTNQTLPIPRDQDKGGRRDIPSSSVSHRPVHDRPLRPSSPLGPRP